MGKTKDRCRYQSVSLPVEFIDKIKEHIEDKPQYRSIADFVKLSTINQMNYESPTLNEALKVYHKYLEKIRKKNPKVKSRDI